MRSSPTSTDTLRAKYLFPPPTDWTFFLISYNCCHIIITPSFAENSFIEINILKFNISTRYYYSTRRAKCFTLLYILFLKYLNHYRIQWYEKLLLRFLYPLSTIIFQILFQKTQMKLYRKCCSRYFYLPNISRCHIFDFFDFRPRGVSKNIRFWAMTKMSKYQKTLITFFIRIVY